MKAVRLLIHNFRSLRDADIDLREFSLIVGPNNGGKSNLLAAIRVFYEKDLKYEEDRDFSKCPVNDHECWIEIEYRCDEDEFEQLKEEYRLPDRRVRVRKYLKSKDKDDEGKLRTGIYAYVNGVLSGSRFYGAKNVQQGKLGDIIFVPAASKIDEHTKLTGPSALRELLNSVLRGVIAKSPSYGALTDAFTAFGAAIKTEEAHPGWSLAQIESTISKDIEDWGLQFALEINPINADDIIKSLVGHHIIDGVLGASLAPTAFGQGFQRHLIFVLIRLASSYTSPAEPKQKKEFSPDLTWILFEEPEAFLHPTQIEILDTSLRTYAGQPGRQVLLSTHNPVFASRSIDALPALTRLSREGAVTIASQIKVDQLQSLLAANQACIDDLKNAGIDVTAEDETLAMESIKFSLWLNPLRASLFFAERVLLVEGPTEYALFSFLLARQDIQAPSRGVAIIDTLGKWNTHRFINILGALRIPHSVLYDLDGSDARSVALEKAIQAATNEFTKAVDTFPEDLERFLGVPASGKPHRKPQHMMWYLDAGKIPVDRLAALRNKVQKLLDA
jgi:putative ATP-dependent endonuclease of the OLD family